MKKRKAQQIMEFMLAAPLLILFFVILSEFAFAFNANLSFTKAVNSSISSYLSNITTNNYKENYNLNIKNYIKTELDNYKVPNTNSLKTELIIVEKYPAIIGSYTYYPSIKYSFLPAQREIQMQTISIFPYQINDFSGYENAITTEELNAIQPETTTEN